MVVLRARFRCAVQDVASILNCLQVTHCLGLPFRVDREPRSLPRLSSPQNLGTWRRDHRLIGSLALTLPHPLRYSQLAPLHLTFPERLPSSSIMNQRRRLVGHHTGPFGRAEGKPQPYLAIVHYYYHLCYYTTALLDSLFGSLGGACLSDRFRRCSSPHGAFCAARQGFGATHDHRFSGRGTSAGRLRT